MEAITVPLVVIPDTETLYTVGPPETTAVIAPAVPLRVTSPVAKPVTASLNVTVKRIGEAEVGSACPAAWLIVTVGDASYVTVLSVLVEARFGFEPASIATPALMEAITVPLVVIPDTETLYTVGPPETTAVIAPAVPLRVTSPVAKPVTASLNVTVKRIGEAEVGSACPAAWLIVTVGGASYVTVLSVLVEARFGFEPASVATPALMEAITVPLVVMPDTETVYTAGPPETAAVVAPAVPLRVTSPVAKPVTASLNTTSNVIVDVDVGSI